MFDGYTHVPGEYSNRGMDRSSAHARQKDPSWAEKALGFLKVYARHHREFSAAMVRQQSQQMVPTPPSERAWGSVFARARALGIIRRAGFQYVTYDKPNSNATPATWWASTIYEVGSELRAALGK